jgi:hypothetical protein
MYNTRTVKFISTTTCEPCHTPLGNVVENTKVTLRRLGGKR